jgi:pyruvate formate lyase activating enzyme
MMDRDATSADALTRAAALGREAGLRYVYPGNRPGGVGDGEDTRCPGCGATLVRRTGFRVLEDRLTPTGGRCPDCAASIPGRWRR